MEGKGNVWVWEGRMAQIKGGGRTTGWKRKELRLFFRSKGKRKERCLCQQP